MSYHQNAELKYNTTYTPRQLLLGRPTWHYATSLNVVGSIPDEVIVLLSFFNPSSRTMALEPTQSLTRMSTRNLPGGKGLPAHKADNFTAICEPIV
jgi:hypothetical protein